MTSIDEEWPHLRQWQTAVWTASGDMERPAPHTDLSESTQPHVAVTTLVDRHGAWGSVVMQPMPDGRTVARIIVHVAKEN